MGRAPCCEKMGLKKGPWSPEEDQILIAYIGLHGHGNWRALPKQAGLLRCGKSCRLRWINYLRPDIKRGNFTAEEEETIIQLHETLGNKWSAIAAKLPGRTDNEIKNVWHTHLKKRVHSSGGGDRNEDGREDPKVRKRRRVVATDDNSKPGARISDKESESESEWGPVVVDAADSNPALAREPSSPQLSNSEISSVTTAAAAAVATTATTTTSSSANNLDAFDPMEYFEDISGFMDEGFYLSGGDHNPAAPGMHLQEDSAVYNFGSDGFVDPTVPQATDDGLYGFRDHQPNAYGQDDHMDFWLNVLTKPGDLSELLQI